MKAVKKTLAIAGIALVVLVAAVVVAFLTFGENAIRKAVEAAASKTLGVPVTIKEVHLSILQGKVGINGLMVKNPQGYANENLLELGEGRVNVKIGSLLSDTIEIDEIKLDGTKLTMEQKGLTNNLKEILDRLPKDEKAEPAAAEPGKNLLVKKLQITNTTVKVKLLPVPGKADTIPMNIDTIEMTDLGSDKKLSIGKLVAKILGAMATGIAKQGVGQLPDDMVKGVSSALGKTAEIGKAAAEEGQKVLEKTGEAGKDLVEGVKGLLGGKKEQK